MNVAKAIRVLAPNDLRLVVRDGWLLILTIALPLFGLLMRWLVPYVGRLVAEWVDLNPYYGLIVASFLVSNQPIFLGAVVGILFIEEREEGTLLALQTSPLSLRSFLGYRAVAAMGLSVALTVVGVRLAGLVSVSQLELVGAAALASLAVPLVALAYAVFIKNKLQALIALRPMQLWAGLPVCSTSRPRPGSGSEAYPLYYPMRLFWSATDGRAEWWLIVPGLIVQGAALFWSARSTLRTRARAEGDEPPCRVIR